MAYQGPDGMMFVRATNPEGTSWGAPVAVGVPASYALSLVVVNGNPHAKGYRPAKPLAHAVAPGQDFCFSSARDRATDSSQQINSKHPKRPHVPIRIAFLLA